MNDLVLAVVRHRIVGNLLVAYNVRQTSEYVLEVDGHVSSLILKDRDVPAEVREIVRLLDEISEIQIAKNFSRGKAQKNFWNSVTDEVLKQSIRPYIDKRICAALPLIAKAGLKIYRKSERYQAINTNDYLDLAPVFKCRPRFFFTLTSDGTLLYTLKVSDGVTDVALFNTNLEELSASPAVFASGNKIYSQQDIPFSKFKPFGAKPRIVVEQKFVNMYMEKVVKPNLERYHVSAYGFNIRRYRSNPHIELRSIDSIFGAAFQLILVYPDFVDGNVSCDFSDKRRPVIMNHTESEGYSFDVFMRNFGEEAKIANLLVSDMGLKSMGELFTLDGIPSAVDLVRWTYSVREMLDEHGIKVSIENSERAYFSGDWSMQSEVASSIDWFDVRIVIKIGNFSIPFKRFFKNISHGDNQFILPDGSCFIIPDEWFEQWSGIIPFVNAGDDSDSAMRIDRGCAQLLPDFLQMTNDKAYEQQPDVDGTLSHSKDISKFVSAQLRPYQEFGVRWMLAISNSGYGGILADDMGLGKTLQVITMLASLYEVPADSAKGVFIRNDTGIRPSLVIMPVSLIFNWKKELTRFAPQLSVYTYTGRNAITGQTLPVVLGQYHIVLSTYGMVRSCADALSQVDFETIVLDESHLAKNPSSKVYSALKRLKAQRHFNLSGTPIENNLTDLWAQMNLVNPNLLGSRTFFEQCFRRPIENNADDSLVQRLRNITHPYILRRTKEQVLNDLPPLTVQTIPCSMTDEQSELYEREKSACRNILLDPNADTKKRRFLILQALTRLRLIANHPALCSDDYVGGSGKTAVVLDTISNIVKSGHKMLVFSSFVRDLNLIAQNLEDAGIKYNMLVGSTHDRDSVVSFFSSDASTHVLLMSLKVGGVGLNLTCADYVLMLNPWWNPAAERQAYGRAHRMGQKGNVTVLRFITQETIEQKIDEMQVRKLQLAANVVQNSEVTVSHDAMPSDDELEEILSA